MPKNIVVFSDGTGQDGGVRPEQTVSNVYKLYRVCHVGSENAVNPREQVAFYDPGPAGLAYEVDRLFTNDQVCVATVDGRWLNVKYERKGRMFSGWVYERYIAQE
jgi:hypothetical protein